MPLHPLIKPRITVLDGAQRLEIHRHALQLLSDVGLRVDHLWARQRFVQGGAQAGEDGRVRLPQELVQWALEAAPSSVQIYDRSGQPAFRLGEGVPDPQTRFGIGVTSLYYQDPQTDALTPFTRRNMREIVRLAASLPQFDLVSTVGVLQDIDPAQGDLYAALEMAANTTKPLVILVADEGVFPIVLDLLEHLCGDLTARPSVLPYVNPITPLVINAGTVDKMRAAIERGLPIIYSSYGMAGASTPITASGTLVVLHAELLAGLTLSQLMKEGTPVILGSLPAYFDMHGMVPFYDAHSYLINLACAEMMAHYSLPHAGTSGSGIGWGADPLAFGHQWMNHLTACLGKVGLVPFVGDNLGSKAFSPVLAVYANEVIAHARRLALGLGLDSVPEDLEEIERVGPGGTFLTSEMTRRLFRQAYLRSEVFRHITLETWQERGCPQAIDVLRSATQRLLADAQPPKDHDELLARGEAFINRLARHT